MIWLAGLIFCAVAFGVAVCLRRFARRLADAEWLDTEPTQTDDGAGGPPVPTGAAGKAVAAPAPSSSTSTTGGPQ